LLDAQQVCLLKPLQYSLTAVRQKVARAGDSGIAAKSCPLPTKGVNLSGVFMLRQF